MPSPPTAGASATAPPGAAGDLAAWNRALNRTHAMAAMRERAGFVVRGIEARRRRQVARAVTAGRHRVVVDVGAEDGWMSEAWADRTRQVVLVDVDPAMLEAARRRRPGVRTVVAEATDAVRIDAALPAGGADVVVLSAILEHLPDPAAAVRLWAHRVRPGGRLVVYVPADRPILGLKAVLRATGLGRLVRGLSLEPAPGHLHVFDRARLRRLLEAAGRIRSLAFDPIALGYTAVVVPRGGR